MGVGGRRTKQFFLRLAVCNVIYYVANRAIKVNSAVLSPSFSLILSFLRVSPPPPCLSSTSSSSVPFVVVVSCSGQLLRGIHRELIVWRRSMLSLPPSFPFSLPPSLRRRYERRSIISVAQFSRRRSSRANESRSPINFASWLVRGG